MRSFQRVVKIGFYSLDSFFFFFFFLSFERKLNEDNVGKYLRAASTAVTSALYLRLGLLLRDSLDFY